MGLCKCPKRKVTNLFCFEHRVNVCEHCLVANHPKCIVQSYLHWLQDSDYNPACLLCNGALDDEVRGECARLLCYDVFHWSCLNDYAQRMPPNTAPAGYQCPSCKAGLFPPANVASPVAEALRHHLLQVNWARTGLGLPLIEERSKAALAESTTPSRIAREPSGDSVHRAAAAAGAVGSAAVAAQQQQHAVTASASAVRLAMEDPTSAMSSRPVHPVQPVQSSSSSNSSSTAAYSHQNLIYPRATGAGDASQGGRKNADSGVPLPFAVSMPAAADHDDNKYKRRSALSFLSQWFRSRDVKGSKGSSAGRMKPTYRRFLMVVVIGCLSFCTLLLVFSILGRRYADDDPMLDPRANPNIMIQADGDAALANSVR